MDNLIELKLNELSTDQMKKVKNLVAKLHKENKDRHTLFNDDELISAKLKNKLFHEVIYGEVPNNEIPYYNIADAFYKLFKKNLEEAGSVVSTLEKSRYKSFVDPIRLMVEKDKVSLDQFRKVYDFLTESDFWKKNILSTNKLRKQIPTLLIQANGKSNKTGNIGTGAKNVTQDYIEKIKREISGDFTS